MNVENIDSRYKLLHLIYEGKTSGILTDHALRESLNDLMKYELITIYNNKLRLTERGRVALKNGINSVVSKVRPNQKQKEVAIIDPATNYLTELVITIAILLIVVLLFMIF